MLLAWDPLDSNCKEGHPSVSLGRRIEPVALAGKVLAF